MAQKKTTPKSRALARSAGRAAGARRAAAKKTSAKQERAAVSRSISKPTKVAEQGVGWGNVARAAAAAGRRLTKNPEFPKGVPGAREEAKRLAREAKEREELRNRYFQNPWRRN